MWHIKYFTLVNNHSRGKDTSLASITNWPIEGFLGKNIILLILYY